MKKEKKYTYLINKKKSSNCQIGSTSSFLKWDAYKFWLKSVILNFYQPYKIYINIYNVKWIWYKNIFHDGSNYIDLRL
jgi:hypothetical protein